jgi:hypothetical protein
MPFIELESVVREYRPGGWFREKGSVNGETYVCTRVREGMELQGPPEKLIELVTGDWGTDPEVLVGLHLCEQYRTQWQDCYWDGSPKEGTRTVQNLIVDAYYLHPTRKSKKKEAKKK